MPEQPSALGPVSIIYCWQSLVLSVGIWVMSRVTKSAILLLAGDDKRRLLWTKHVVMPLVPVLWGMLLVFVVPVLPDELVKYAAEQSEGVSVREWMYYLAYGALVGQFSSYLHDRLQSLIAMKSTSFEDTTK